ncbi:hypothetical protein C8R44DRAFT_275580 [Mycena epipterygia]|nr:hypothetical protein C8R44DRAFT_275580 [Mycena epipterygia]
MVHPEPGPPLNFFALHMARTSQSSPPRHSLLSLYLIIPHLMPKIPPRSNPYPPQSQHLSAAGPLRGPAAANNHPHPFLHPAAALKLQRPTQLLNQHPALSSPATFFSRAWTASRSGARENFNGLTRVSTKVKTPPITHASPRSASRLFPDH